MRLAGAEPSLPDDPFGPDSAHQRDPLKHRAPGETRDVPIPLDMVGLIKEHIAERATANGRLFTSAFGAWLDTNNWREHFWKPALDHVMRDLEIPEGSVGRERRELVEGNLRRQRLRELDFYRLRHAAITAWLYDNVSIWEVAQRSGNSVQVIEARYAGFIPKASRTPMSATKPPAAWIPEALGELTEAEINSRIALLVSELSTRRHAA